MSPERADEINRMVDVWSQLFKHEVVLRELCAERDRQDAKWGQQDHLDGTGTEEQIGAAELAKRTCQSRFAAGHGAWSDVLTEEVAEALAESNWMLLRDELVQVAAVAVAWIEAIDRRG